MRGVFQRFSLVCFAVLLFSSTAIAQPQKGGGANPSAAGGGGQQSPTSSTSSPSAGGGNGSSLAGLSYAREDWNRLLSHSPNYQTLGLKKPENLVFVCFRLVPGQSANQPFILEPDSPPDPWRKGSYYTVGQAVAPTNPNGHYYQAKFTMMSGSSPVTFTTNGSDIIDTNELKWADMGEASSPFLQSLRTWGTSQSYDEGERVTPSPQNGHFYRAVFRHGKQAGDTEPTWKTDGSPTPDKNGLTWVDLGVGVLNPNIEANCKKISPKQPLLMDQILGVAIDTSGIPDRVADRFKVLNLNITNQQGASLNPTPIRPSLTAGAASGAEIAGLDSGALRKAYYITWPNQMPGDTIPTVSVNLIYTPVAPGLPWDAETFYPAGSIVAPSDPNNKNGHYYVALNSGISADDPPSFDQHVIVLTTVPDKKSSGLSWKDMGLTPPNPAPQTWTAKHPYGEGELIIPPTDQVTGHFYRAQHGGKSDAKPPASFSTDGSSFSDGPDLVWKDMGVTVLTPAPATWAANTGFAQNAQVVPAQANGHYYQAVTAGVSSANAPAFPVDQGTVVESPGLQYLDAGTSLPASAKLKIWSKNTAFFLNDVILDPKTGHYYSVVQPGISGDDPPQFSVSSLTSGTVSGGTASQPVAWQDIGAALPSSVTAGAAPADVTVNLLNYTYPQVHALSRFNLASGIVFDFIKPPQLVNTGSTSSPSYVSTPGTPLVDAVLAVTAYIKPIDAERKFQRSDLIPGASVGFSLTSPSSNFYFGGSSELFLRNLQVMGGVALLKISELGPTASGSTTVTATVQQEKVRGFVGVSFNITGFLQTLF